jgi:hypothetical protein
VLYCRCSCSRLCTDSFKRRRPADQPLGDAESYKRFVGLKPAKYSTSFFCDLERFYCSIASSLPKSPDPYQEEQLLRPDSKVSCFDATSAHLRVNISVYTGYLDVDAGAKHLFFYFFESRRNPDKGASMNSFQRHPLVDNIQCR